MILGYKRLKDCSPGQLVRLHGGGYLLLSEYYIDNDAETLSAYISGSGETFASGERRKDEWVAIIDLDWLEVNIADEADYPVPVYTATGEAE